MVSGHRSANDLLWVRLAIGWTTTQLTLALLSVAVLQRALRLPRGARGRARTVGLAITTGLHALITTASVGVLLWAARVSVGHVLGGTVASLLFGLTHLAYSDLDLAWVPTLYHTATTLQAVTAALIVVLSMSCWFLVPAARRERFWWGFDAALVVAFLAVSFLLPLSPTEGRRREPDSRGGPRERHHRLRHPARPAHGWPSAVGI